MTIDEAIAYFKRHIDLYCVTGICREAEEMAIQALEQTQWIPCSEKLPEKDGRYWVWCEIFIVPDHVDEPCSYYGSREASYLDGHWYGDSIGEVIAWMPLPTPWKGE